LRPTEPVTRFCSQLHTLVAEMFETMYANDGIGLAATQVGIGIRLAVLDISFGKDPSAKMVLVNPFVAETDGRQYRLEGCLSVPDFRESVMRPNQVIVQTQDINGNSIQVTGKGLLAVCLSHEIDHLNGQLYLDRLPKERRAVVRRQVMRALEKQAAS